MMTSMVKSAGVSSPSSRPTLMAINPINARVFINAAMLAASRFVRPVIFAPRKQPPSLPMTAASKTTPHASHAPAPSNAPICVFKPVFVKKTGTNATSTTPEKRLRHAATIACS